MLGCFGEEESLVRRTPCFRISELSHVRQWCPGGECGLVFQGCEPSLPLCGTRSCLGKLESIGVKDSPEVLDDRGRGAPKSPGCWVEEKCFLVLRQRWRDFDKGGCSPWSSWGREGGMRDNNGGGVGAGKQDEGVRGKRLCHNGVSLGGSNERRGWVSL